MKTNKTLVVSMLVITAFIMSSCNSSLSIVKRRYNNGYYVSISKGVNNQKEKQIKDEKSIEKESIVKNEIDEKLIDYNKSAKVEKEKGVNENLTASIESKNDNKLVQKISDKRDYEPQGLNAGKNSITKNDKVLIKKLIKENKKQLNSDKKSSLSDTNVFEIIFAIILPPLAVFLHSGIGSDFWISLILTLLFWIPGVILCILCDPCEVKDFV